MLLISVVKLHAFLSLTIGSMFVWADGRNRGRRNDLVIRKGRWLDPGVRRVIVALGVMLGTLLAESGGSDQIARTVLRRSGVWGIPWAMALIALLVGIPLFFEIGVVLLPIVFTMARHVEAARLGAPEGSSTSARNTRPSSYLLVGIPALAGLSVLHGLVPPHPGPLTAINSLCADLGKTMIYGLIVAVPTAIAGPLFGMWIARRVHPTPPPALLDQIANEEQHDNPPSFLVTLFTRRRDSPDHRCWWRVQAGANRLWHRRRERQGRGAHRPLGDRCAWLIAVLIRLATGSATVETVTAAGIVTPLVASHGGVNVSLVVLAIGAGSLFCSHVNDAGLWLVKEYFGMTVKQTIVSWSIMETIVSVVTFACVYGLSLII